MNQDNISHLNRDVRLAASTVHPSQLLTKPDFRRDPMSGAAPHKKFVAKGHDAQLMDAQMGRLETTLTLRSGAVMKGLITRRDKFTVTLAHSGGEEIFYKHAIEGVLIVGIRDVQRAH